MKLLHNQNNESASIHAITSVETIFDKRSDPSEDETIQGQEKNNLRANFTTPDL